MCGQPTIDLKQNDTICSDPIRSKSIQFKCILRWNGVRMSDFSWICCCCFCSCLCFQNTLNSDKVRKRLSTINEWLYVNSWFDSNTFKMTIWRGPTQMIQYQLHNFHANPCSLWHVIRRDFGWYLGLIVSLFFLFLDVCVCLFVCLNFNFIPSYLLLCFRYALFLLDLDEFVIVAVAVAVAVVDDAVAVYMELFFIRLP